MALKRSILSTKALGRLRDSAFGTPEPDRQDFADAETIQTSAITAPPDVEPDIQAERFSTAPDLFASGTGEERGAVFVEIGFGAAPACRLTTAFVAELRRQGRDGDFDLPARHARGAAARRPAEAVLLADWRDASGETVHRALCPAGAPAPKASSALERFGASPPCLLALSVPRAGRVALALRRGGAPTQALLYSDDMLLGWVDLPAAGPTEDAGSDVVSRELAVDPDATAPARRLAVFTLEGVQLLHTPEARGNGQPWLGGHAAKFSLLSVGSFTASVIERPPAHQKGVLALYAIHTKQGTLSRVHTQVVGELRRRGAVVCVINSFQGNASELSGNAPGVNLLISRSDFGRDFASWAGAFACYSDWICGFDRTLFINDSLVGPVTDTSAMFDFFAGSESALSALSDSYDQSYHLQSSVFQVRKAAWDVRRFKDFFLDYQYPDLRPLVVAQGELGLSKAALSAGVDVDVMAPYDSVSERWLDALPDVMARLRALPECRMTEGLGDDLKASIYTFEKRFLEWAQHVASDIRQGITRNAQHTFWDTLVRDFHYPFIKRDVLTTNPENLPSLFLLKDLVSDDRRATVRATIHETSLQASRVFRV